jgi:hypothetical protein
MVCACLQWGNGVERASSRISKRHDAPTRRMAMEHTMLASSQPRQATHTHTDRSNRTSLIMKTEYAPGDTVPGVIQLCDDFKSMTEFQG